MAAQIEGIFTERLQQNIIASKILVVGAGGIGCEILKDLVLSGFVDIEIIDLDTIEVSNLNRQFLFRSEHVGKSKAKTARESALTFNPDAQIVAYHDSIFSSAFGLSYYKNFSLVLMALDNKAARNHVNRMCLNADVPLLESGTAGYSGQAELISKGRTQCYECTPKSSAKTYPGCTIRNTPSEPIHCIVWAKHLFNQLFGEFDPDQDVSPDAADPEANGDVTADSLLAKDSEQGNVERVSTRKWAESNGYDAQLLFNKLFHDDIKYLLCMGNLWKTRTAPVTMQWHATDPEAPAPSSYLQRRVWSEAECCTMLAQSIAAIKLAKEKLADGDNLVWDKDDKDAMDFVAACATIRSNAFGIETRCPFDIKSMAGNIIPAIATTNAIVAGLVVMRAFNVLQQKFNQCQSVYVRLVPNSRKQLLVPDKTLMPPNPKCYVCSDKPTAVIQIDTTKVTCKAFHDDVLVKALNMQHADVIEESKGLVLISSEEGETECNNDKLLSELGVVDGSVLKLDDFFQCYELTLIVHQRTFERTDEAMFEIIADADLIKAPAATNGSSDKAEATETDAANKPDDGVTQLATAVDAHGIADEAEDDDDDDICCLDDEVLAAEESAVEKPQPTVSVPKKRKGDDGEPVESKRAKIDEPANTDDDLILIDDD